MGRDDDDPLSREIVQHEVTMIAALELLTQ